MQQEIGFQVNGKRVTVNVDPGRSVLSVLRHDLALTGSKYGCGKGLCGACTVVVEKRALRSCRLAVKSIIDKEVVTIEGLSPNGELHPLQKAFMENDALQCGYCTPGMIMNAFGLLLRNPQPTRDQILRGMEGNLCRCGAHIRIIRAIEEASRQMKGGAA